MKKLISSLCVLCVLCVSSFAAGPCVQRDTGRGLIVCTTPDQGLGYFGTEPTAQRAGAAQAAITDNSTGTANSTPAIAAGVGVNTITIPVSLATITAADVLTAYTPGYKFKLLSISYAAKVPVTTGSKLATLSLKIGSTAVTGGAVALTSANCTPLGKVTDGTSITAANTGANNSTISVVAASVTAFAEGDGYLFLRVQNMDTADAHATELVLLNELRAADVAKGWIKGGP